MREVKSLVVVGGGLVGLGTALAIQKSNPRLLLTVLEKEGGFGRHQSTHNSGVLHAGLYYKPGSIKARMAVQGIRQMTAFCQSHQIPHEICGKIVVATEEKERPHLETLWQRGQANGLKGLKRLGASEIKEREPHAAGLEAILVPEEGIVDYAAVVKAMTEDLKKGGATLLPSGGLRRGRRTGGGWVLETKVGEVATDFVVTCAGLHSDRVARAMGSRPRLKIMPFRGEYFALKPSRSHLVNHLIYPVPDPAYPFLGVHFTRLIGGGIEAGPNAVLAFAREGYTKTAFHPGELFESLTFSGLRKFLFKHRGMVASELRRSLSRRLFAESLQKLVPEVRVDDLDHGGAGVRAQAMLEDGTLVQDFEFLQEEGVLHVLNAPSPGATASLAIGGEIAQMVMARIAEQGR